MTAFEYLDIAFQQASVKNGEKYELKNDGMAKGAYMLLGFLRFYYKWRAVPVHIVNFVLVQCGFKAEPISPLIPKAVPDPIPPKPSQKIQEAPPLARNANGQDTPIPTQ